MGIVQKDALRTTIATYLGMVLGYLNKAYLFIILLSTVQIGLVNLVFMVGALFAQFANFGTVNTTWRFFPYLDNKEKKHFGFLSLNLLIVLSGIAFFSLLVLLFGDLVGLYFQEKSSLFVESYYWIIPVGIGIVLFKMLDSYLRALFKNVFPVIANEIIYRLVVTGLLCLYAAQLLTFEQLFVALCIAQFVPAILLIGYLVKLGEWHFSVKSIQIPRRFRKIILTYSVFSYLNSLGAILVISLDAIMISGMLGLSEYGIYSVVRFLMGALMVPYSAIMRVSAPLVSKYWKTREMGEMQELYQKVSSVTLFIGLFLFLGVWVSREELFQFLGPEYQPGIYIFLCLMIGRLLDMYFGLNGTILVTSKRYKFDMIFTSLLILLVIVLNLYFIPKWGLMGAALSTTIAYFGYNFSRMIFVWYTYKIHPFALSQFVVMAIFTGCIVFFEMVNINLGNVWLNIGLKSILVCVMFPLAIYLLKIEPEIVNYVDKGIATFNKKLGRK